MAPLIFYLVVSAILLGIGIYGLSTKRNAMRMLFAIEIMVNAANLNILAFARVWFAPGITGQAIVLFSIAITAAEVVVALAIILVISRTSRTVDIHELKKLKG